MGIGFHSGIAPPCVFKRKARNLWLTSHGDDVALPANDDDVAWSEEISTHAEVSTRGRLGPNRKGLNATRIPNRIAELNSIVFGARLTNVRG
eukprot:9238521-Pyramimonas_sp.AAC.1